MADREQELRNRAYAIWEREGRPHGEHDEHWKRAQEEHEATDKEAASTELENHEQPDGTATASPLSDSKPQASRGSKVKPKRS